jgi:cathepsin L
MIAFLAITLLVVSVNCIPISESHIESEWVAFKRDFRNNAYNGVAEEALRREIFEKNYRLILNHNMEAEQGVHTYTMGVNQFTDLTDEEYVSMLTLRVDPQYVNKTHSTEKINANANPASVDWRTKNVVTHVKDQGQCGSCFAFSATDSIESQYAIATGKLVTLAPQQIVDCIHSGGDVCKTGGDPIGAMRLIIQEGGQEPESAYPYHARMGTCQFSRAKAAVSITGVHQVQAGSEAALTTAIAGQPVAVAIDASGNGFRNYKSGVYNAGDCSSSTLNHGVLAVGYGNENGQDYYLIKNSWGTVYGASGFIKMARNHNNHCGILNYAAYPTGAH